MDQFAGSRTSPRGKWLGLASLSLGVAMIIVDATIVNVAVPSMIRELKLDSTTAEWINTIYALVFAALLITLGRVGDVWGRRRLYLAGLVVFIAASMLAGAAPSGQLLIAARVAQGIGGAMILPATQSILNTNFRGRDRAIAFGVWGAVIGGVAAIGPLIGGWLTTNLSWRWAFFINLPIGLIALAGTMAYIAESRDEDARPGFDPLGFVLVTVGLGGAVFGLIEGRNYGWWAPNHPFAMAGLTWPADAPVSVIAVAIAGGLLCLALFAVVETLRKRRGAFILFDFDLWKYRGFRFGNLAGTIVSLGEFGLLFVLPLFLQAVLGYSAFDTGLVFLALAGGSFIAAPLAATFAHRFGNRWVVTMGMALEAVGIVATSLLLSATMPGWAIAPTLFVYGIGVGFATAQLTSLVLSDVPPERGGLASGANSTLRQVGSALGIAILGTVLFSSLVSGTRSNLDSALPGVSATCRETIASLVDESAGQVLPALRNPSAGGQEGGFGGSISPDEASCFRDPSFIAALPQAVSPIESAFVDAARLTGFVAAAFVMLGVVFSLLLPGGRAHAALTEPGSASVDPGDPVRRHGAGG